MYRLRAEAQKDETIFPGSYGREMADLEPQSCLIDRDAVIICHYLTAVSHHAVRLRLESDLCAVICLWSQMFAFLANYLILLGFENRHVKL